MILNTERQDGGQQLKKKEEEENDNINGANGAVVILLLLDICFNSFNKHKGRGLGNARYRSVKVHGQLFLRVVG